MNKYKVGPDDLDEWELSKIPTDAEWVIYSCEIGDYCGSGTMLCKVGDSYLCHDMGHCSCFGPMEEFNAKSMMDAHVAMRVLKPSKIDRFPMDGCEPVWNKWAEIEPDVHRAPVPPRRGEWGVDVCDI
ncbi:MAG: hypothetical protein KDA34_14845 [Phycisphaerales bacterium]|nr:hypothetical protein [Phycisphaerales bacterium]